MLMEMVPVTIQRDRSQKRPSFMKNSQLQNMQKHLAVKF